MGRLFGTDGVRGVANVELSPEMAFRLGRCSAHVLRREGTRNGVRQAMLVGRDTRASGDLLECAFVAGACSVGMDVMRAGVVTTPGIAYLTASYGAIAGVVISASHNPAQYNGIKLFSCDGYKLPDDKETEVEEEYERMASGDTLPRPAGTGVGRVLDALDASERYLDFLTAMCPGRLDGLKVVLDCANGAASRLAPQAFRRLGATVHVINDYPDGQNINSGCGSTVPSALQSAMERVKADAGFAFDGDADRAVAVDENGRLLDGDYIMAMCAVHLRNNGRLRGDAIAATVLSNMGLEAAVGAHGIRVVKTRVGDKYVLEEVKASGLSLGGEQSGHIIFADCATTGDGILTAIKVSELIASSGRSLSSLASIMRKFPQVMRNVVVKDKRGLEEDRMVSEAVESARTKLGDRGRVLVRPSGTEPVVRIMVEGEDEEEVKSLASDIEEVVKARFGRPRSGCGERCTGNLIGRQ